MIVISTFLAASLCFFLKALSLLLLSLALFLLPVAVIGIVRVRVRVAPSPTARLFEARFMRHVLAGRSVMLRLALRLVFPAGPLVSLCRGSLISTPVRRSRFDALPIPRTLFHSVTATLSILCVLLAAAASVEGGFRVLGLAVLLSPAISLGAVTCFGVGCVGALIVVAFLLVRFLLFAAASKYTGTDGAGKSTYDPAQCPSTDSFACNLSDVTESPTTTAISARATGADGLAYPTQDRPNGSATNGTRAIDGVHCRHAQRFAASMTRILNAFLVIAPTVHAITAKLIAQPLTVVVVLIAPPSLHGFKHSATSIYSAVIAIVAHCWVMEDTIDDSIDRTIGINAFVIPAGHQLRHHPFEH